MAVIPVPVTWYLVKQAALTDTLPLSALDGENGFRIDGVEAFDYSGHSVSAAGDINGDGVDDLIIGASDAGPNGNNRAGFSYVVFGQTGDFNDTLPLSNLDGKNGFRIDGVATDNYSGSSVSAGGGIINGDGVDDVIIGAYGADPNGNNRAGSSYVVFGQTGDFNDILPLSALDGENGFRIDGVATDDLSGTSVSAAGGHQWRWG